MNPDCGPITESRVGRGADSGPFAVWGSTPRPPVCGAAWLRAVAPAPARLSNGLSTDRHWCAFDFDACLIKGFCRPAPIAAALAPEGLHPVLAECDGEPFAMATLWLNAIRDSVCGTYREIVLSFDATARPTAPLAFRTSARRAPWALAYPNFGPSACEAQFLHSLWIDSPLSILWGREMQGFPKHPRPTTSTLTNDAREFAFDIRWGSDLVMRGIIRKRFGLRGLVRESLGLLRTQSTYRVLGFLAARAFPVPIVMPAATAAQNGVGRRYLGRIWKGLHPMAVQVQPWAEDDVMELGPAAFETGCEPHNGNRLLTEAEFRPVSATFLPRAAAVVLPGAGEK